MKITIIILLVYLPFLLDAQIYKQNGEYGLNVVEPISMSVANTKDFIGQSLWHVENLYKDLEMDKTISPKLKNKIAKFSFEQKSMFVKGIQELEKLKNKETDPSQYMINMIEHSSELSFENGEKFVQLVGEVFSEKPFVLDFFRKILEAGPHISGEVLEPILHKIIFLQKKQMGFNPNITDDIDSINTMTHHFGEFLQVGYNRGNILGKLASDIIDRKFKIIGGKLNEGDIRNGYFSTMIGNALNRDKIIDKEAVNLVRWAYTTHYNGKIPPPFSGLETVGSFMSWRDYKIEKWVLDYNRAYPNDQIKLK